MITFVLFILQNQNYFNSKPYFNFWLLLCIIFKTNAFYHNLPHEILHVTLIKTQSFFFCLIFESVVTLVPE